MTAQSPSMPGSVVWVSGRPSAGKSTLARHLRDRLRDRNLPTLLLDGDEVRATFDPPPGYDAASRDAFYRTLARLAALAAAQGQVAVVAATSSRREHVEEARRLWPGLVSVFVDVPVEECERRDAKGLYARARRGEAPGFPGVGEPFEPPRRPDVVACGGEDLAALERVVERVTGPLRP